MRVARIDIGLWRNIDSLELTIPAETRFVCLVGENGTGKSAVLELITWAAHHIGLAPQVPLRRVPPGGFPGEAEVKIQFDLDRPDIREQVRARRSEDEAEQWDGTLEFHHRSWLGTDPGGLPSGVAIQRFAEGGHFQLATAGGLDSVTGRRVGAVVVDSLRTLPELLHLYIDAERVFPTAPIRDEEVLAIARQDPSAPDWLKSQASQLTQNLYLEWMRSVLGRQQRDQTLYYQQALTSAQRGETIPPPDDSFASYRAALLQVMPHLRFDRLDQERRQLIFDTSGEGLVYEDLSGGERELAFLVGQIDRFGVRDGLFLLDEPELHLNPELLRGWLNYLRASVDSGQAWVATHSLEAAEVAGRASTFVLERGPNRRVHRAAPLSARPALATLAAALGTPAFSVGRSRFVLIEGERDLNERERFANVLDASTADRFVEAGGCNEVLAKVRALRELASEEEQLRIGGVVDRDFRSESDRTRVLAEDGVHVLSVHEIENLFLDVALLERLLHDRGDDPEAVGDLLREAMDRYCGRWAFEKSKREEDWREDARPPLVQAAQVKWSDVAEDLGAAARRIAEAIPGLSGSEAARRRLAIAERLRDYQCVRNDPVRLSRECFGKETLAAVAVALGFQDATGVETRAAVLWRSGDVERPTAASEVREYLDGIETLGA